MLVSLKIPMLKAASVAIKIRGGGHWVKGHLLYEVRALKSIPQGTVLSLSMRKLNFVRNTAG